MLMKEDVKAVIKVKDLKRYYFFKISCRSESSKY